MADAIIGAAYMVMKELTAMGCMVSVGEQWLPGGKTIVLGTSDKVMEGPRTSLRALDTSSGKHARHIGVDYAPGRRGARTRKVAKARLKEARGRKVRIGRLRLPAKAVSRIVRTGLIPAAFSRHRGHRGY